MKLLDGIKAGIAGCDQCLGMKHKELYAGAARAPAAGSLVAGSLFRAF